MRYILFLIGSLMFVQVNAQTNPLWTEQKVKNYLPHMTVPDVEALLKKSDMVIIPIGALEQHGKHLPIGTDFYNGVERCKLIAQERNILVAPVLMAGQSPYHMGFAGTISLNAETIIKAHLEAVESLIKHGFKRFIIMSAHGGNKAISNLIVDQVNQTTSGIAVNFDQAIQPFMKSSSEPPSKVLDRHAGTGETSSSLYLTPTLVQLDKAVTAEITMPKHLEAMILQVLEGEPTALMLFLAEGLKAEETRKKTSAAEMSTTGVWGKRNLNESTAKRGEEETENIVDAAVKFIDRWNELVDM